MSVRHDFAVLFGLLVLVGCDETDVRVGPSELSTAEADALRVLVSPAGIATLVAVSNPTGLALTADPMSIPSTDPDVELSIGPLQQTLGVTGRASDASDDAISLRTVLDGTTVFVPARVVVDGDLRICRWRVDAAAVETNAELTLVVDPEMGPQFGVEQAPVVELGEAAVVSLDGCDVDFESFLPDDFETLVLGYVSDAVASSSANALPAAPLDVLGLIRGNLQLTRNTPFENRTGTFVVETEVSPRPGALQVSSSGLAIALDAAAEADRARCAPPTAIGTTPAGGAAAPELEQLTRLGADFAVAISAGWLTRSARAATLAGYACRGLEDARHPAVNDELIPIADVQLGEIGLGNLPTSGNAAITIAPGSLPTLQLNADSGTVNVTWPDLQVEVYAEIAGARTRVARLVADTELGLGPITQVVDVAKFELESIDVVTTRIDSEFLATVPEQDDLDRWTRRTLLTVLEEQFELPLPLTPAASLRVVSMQVRSNDVVAYLRFE